MLVVSYGRRAPIVPSCSCDRAARCAHVVADNRSGPEPPHGLGLDRPGKTPPTLGVWVSGFGCNVLCLGAPLGPPISYIFSALAVFLLTPVIELVKHCYATSDVAALAFHLCKEPFQ